MNHSARVVRFALATLAVFAVVVPAAVQAHFQLLEPASWLVENQLGDPQKLAPCGSAPTAAANGTGYPAQQCCVGRRPAVRSCTSRCGNDLPPRPLPRRARRQFARGAACRSVTRADDRAGSAVGVGGIRARRRFR